MARRLLGYDVDVFGGNMRLKSFYGILAIILALWVSNASADESRYARLRYVDGEVTLYPVDKQRPNDATVNTPLADGDELETRSGRAELAFRNGVVVRVGNDSSIRIASTYSPMTIELLQGTLFVDSHMVNSLRDELMIQAGSTQVYLIDEGNMRVDLGQEGTVRVTSIEGQSEVRANGKGVLLEAGERTYIDQSNNPETPQAAEKFDDLDDWNASRMEAYAGNDNNYAENEYVDESIYYDSYDLDNYGDWQAYGDYGNVWVPDVSDGWRPYSDGRWQYTGGNYFWVGYEPWGWAPYRYGRWGWGNDLGWYWVPGNVFGAAWVSWYDYGDYIGWCPLDYWNRPIFVNNYYFNGHYWNGNYWNGVQKQKTLGTDNSWTFVKKTDLGAINAKRVSLNTDKTRTIQMDRTKIQTAPQPTLKSYVLPTTIKSRGYVNDQRVVREPGDIKNPIGVKNAQDVTRIDDRKDENKNSQTKSKTVNREGSESGKRTTVTLPSTQNWEKERKSPEIKKSPVNIPKQYNRQDSYNGKEPSVRYDKDSQFQRNSSKSYQSVSPYRTFNSPYYRDRNQYGDDGRKTRVFPDKDVNRNGYNPESNGYDQQREISPRYFDEARRYFGRFDGNRQSVTKDNTKPNSSNYKSPSYKQPESSKRVETRSAPPRTNSKPPSVSKPSSGYKKPPSNFRH